MKYILSKILTKTPDAKSGGLFLNLLGYSLFKSIGFFLFEKIRKKIKPNLHQDHNDLLAKIENQGFVVINDFLKEDDFDLLKNEVLDYSKKKSMNFSETFSLPLMTMLENKIGSNILKKYFYKNSDIYKIACYLSGISSNFYPTIEFNYLKSKKNNLEGFKDGQHNIHYDVTYSSFKAILYMEDTNKNNGAFEYIKGSHKFNIKRLSIEYLNSISKDKKKLTKLTKNFLHNLVSIEGKKNSLIVMNAKGMHRRGLFYKDTVRSTIFVDYRFLHSLGNFLPKKLLKSDI
jgi:hypothetical protein